MRFKQIKPQHVKTNINNMKYRQYSPTRLTNAYVAVKDHTLTVKGAARQFGVPVRTLRDRTMGLISIETVKSGRAPVLSMLEETKLVTHLKEMAQMGYGYTRSEVVDIASEFARSMGKRAQEKPLTIRWYQGFMSRWNEELKLVKPRALEISRAKAGNPENVTAYFDELTKVIKKYNLEDKPHLIFNVDEKGIQQNHSPPAVVGGRNINVQAVVSQTSSTTTILGCGSAAGTSIPPYFVFAGARMRQELMAGKSPGAEGTVTESGWSNSEVFRKYLEDHFLIHAPGRGDDPILLILDGHKSHVSIGLVDWAKQHNIILFVLPAHTSHFLQPLDVGCYGPFHRIYNNECHKETKTMSTVVTRYDICSIACRAYSKALSPSNLQTAFRRTGIYPLDSTAIDSNYLLPSEAFNHVTEQNDDEQVPLDGMIMEETGDKECEILEPEPTCTMTGDFFVTRIEKVKKIKSETQTKTRKTLSKITSGHCITEDSIRDRISDHQKIHPSKDVQTANKNKSNNVSSKKSKKPKAKPQEPGPSNCIVRIPDALDMSEDESQEDEIPEKDKCCACKLFTPIQARESTSLIFTKWVACDNCPHWVHLGFCTEQSVIRRGDNFLCIHCS